ncbi:MAG: two-component sensor histidine kinase [Deltaproteobacteria bacterium HGW-Deltaproteobacteria-4]|nr:MAG: two-component sensor histidine kinase [Deltaproteobacteria bacterium HGW-Deltaproteobacteria-4]
MSLRPPIRSSIRFKLTLWFALTLAILMLSSETFWDRHLATILEGNTDSRLARTGDILDDLIYNEADDAPRGEETQCRELRNFVYRHNWGVAIQQRNPRGEVTCFTENLGELRFPLNRSALRHLSQGGAYFETFTSETGERYRVMTRPRYDNARRVDVLQVGENLEANDTALALLLWKRIIYTPLLIILLSGCGWFLAGRALSPLQQITDAIRKITAENLNLRLPVDKKRNELTDLSISFNETLERLANSFSRIKQFTGDASHELRTPLAILKGETEVSLRWSRGEEELRQTLISNLEEIERMERITEGLLQLAKSESGEFHLNLSSFSLNDLLQDLYIHSKTLGEAKKIETILQMQVDHEVFIRADQMHLHRALLNFVTNAVKYTPEGGEITLTLALNAANEAQIHVRDTGMGIPAEHLPHIFERFYRVDEARNRNIGGTGLGLSIVKAIISAHQGRIRVFSTPGQGSEFIIDLPLDPTLLPDPPTATPS